jgi:H+-transporting ATPase
LGLGIDALRTLSVVAIVFGSQAAIYAIRGRSRFWGLRPTVWLVISSIADLLIITTLATRGIAMASIPMAFVACEFAGAIALFLILDTVKICTFARLGLT